MKFEYAKAYIRYMKSPKGVYEWVSYGKFLVIMTVVSIVCIGAWLYGR